MLDTICALIKQSTAVQPLIFFMQDSTDTYPNRTGKTGLAPTVTISKNGAAFGAPAGAVTELSNGYYQVAANATDSNTLGNLLLKATGAGAANTFVRFQIVAFDPQDAVRLGLTALPNAAAGANTGLPVVGTQVPNATAGANNGLPTVDANNAVKVQSGTGANQINLNAGAVVTVTNVTNGVTVTTNNDKTNYALSAAALTAIENQIWNALTASHTTANTFGLKLGALADPWGVALPGAYGVGTAGNIVGNNLNATITSRSSLVAADILAQVNAALDAADAELASLPADSCSLRERIKFSYQYNRFKRTCTNVLETAFKANSSSVLGTDAVSNDGTTFTKNKMT